MKNAKIVFLFLFINKIFCLDTSFGQGNGYITTQNPKGFEINKIKVQSDNKIVAVGYTQDPNSKAIIVRYNIDGSIDTSFGINGIITSSIGSSQSTTQATDLAIQSDGKIVVTGYSFDTSGSTLILVARYTTTGALDSTFASGGVFSSALGNGSSANTIAIQSDGKIVVAGCASISNAPNAFVARFTTSGGLDDTFGSGGIVTGLIGSRTVILDNVLDSSDNIFVTGFYASSTGQQQYFIAKYNSSGALVASFGSGGVVLGTIGASSLINSIKLDSSGKILIGGSTNINNSDQFLVARYNSTGTLDTTFNTVGYITQLIGNSSRVNELAVQSDNKVVVGGYISYVVDEAVVSRYNTNGTVDTTFANGGSISLALGRNARVNSVVIQNTDQKIVAGGTELDLTTRQQVGLVARLNKNNTDSVVITSIASNSTINTKKPTISGTSSIASAQVQIVINGVVFTTVSTDGSGNWNAGSSSILPVGINSIQANLISGAVTVVSQEISFVVVDNLGEDSIYSYSTSNQSITAANSFQNITFNNPPPVIKTWTYNGTDTFTCNKSGKYSIQFTGEISSLNLTGTTPIINISIISKLNGTEIAGSQANSMIDITDEVTTRALTKSFITNINANDTLTFQMTYTLAAGSILSGNPGLSTNANSDGATKPSISVTIIRLE